MLQTNVTIEFKADVKLEAMEEDRFMVCCLENRNDCSQVTEIKGMTRTESQYSILNINRPGNRFGLFL